MFVKRSLTMANLSYPGPSCFGTLDLYLTSITIMITVANKYQIVIHVWPGLAAPMIRIQCGMKSWGRELWASITCKILSHKNGCCEGSTNASVAGLTLETQWNPYTVLLQPGNYHPSSFCLRLPTCILFILSSHHAWVSWVWGQGRLTSTSLYLIQDEGCWSDMILPYLTNTFCCFSCLSMKHIATGSKVV